jgi:hypothetical protein
MNLLDLMDFAPKRYESKDDIASSLILDNYGMNMT